MLLRLTKEIKPTIAKKLEFAKKQLETFSNLLNSRYLQEELNFDLQKKISKFSKPTEHIFILREDLGSFLDPEHFMLKDWGEFSYKYNRKTHKNPQKYFLTAEIYRKYPESSEDQEIEFSFKILKKKKKEPIEKFEFGEFDGSARTQKMFDFFNYFSCQLPMYAMVREKLLEKKALLEEYTGKSFTESLLALFSYKSSSSKPFVLDIKRENLEKRILFNDSTQRETFNKNTLLISAIWDMGDEDKETEDLLFTSVGVRLAANKKLLLDFTLDETSINSLPILLTDKNLEQLMNNKTFSAFIAKNLKNWLEDLVNYVDFAAQIFDKTKTKFLLKKL